jgi:ATPase subunit of ABC transporter with duplicated ATPase domains
MLAPVMFPPKYPFSQLAAVRNKRVDDARHDLANKTTAHAAAERDRRAAEDNRDAHDAAAAFVRDVEANALARGELRAADLARADAWEVRIGAENAALALQVDRARVSEAGALEGEQRTRALLASRRADADAVAKDRARWSDGLRKRAEAKEEEAASEAWRPKR